jgi:hypothetical protein
MSKDNVVSLFPSVAIESRLSEAEVTAERLRAALDLAAIETSIDEDGDIATGKGFDFPIWIALDRDSSLVAFHTYWDTQLSPEAANDLNATYKIVQFMRRGDRIVANYQMTYRYGVDTRQVISMARDFAAICRLAYKNYEPRQETVEAEEA